MRGRVGRRRFLAGCLAGVASAGCLGSPGASVGAGTGGPSTSGAAGPPTAEEALPLPMAPGDLGDAAVSGGVPKDGIPAIDDPSFASARSVDDWLAPGDPVFGVVRDGVAKAYPQRILVRHEICNDVLAGRPVSVTYCPLTGTAMGFERGGTTFGVSGRLLNNNLIMYDRATETWWPQVLATSVPGPWNASPGARSLVGFRVVWTTWGRWRQARPETRVLTRETGYASNYATDPYGGYDPRRGLYRPDSRIAFPTLPGPHDRFPPKAVVVGARTPAGAVAVPKDRLREAGLLLGTVGDADVAAVYDGDLDTGYLYRVPGDRRLRRGDGRVLLDGDAHPPGEVPLPRLLALDAMWFAWAGCYPETGVP